MRLAGRELLSHETVKGHRKAELSGKRNRALGQVHLQSGSQEGPRPRCWGFRAPLHAVETSQFADLYCVDLEMAMSS